MTTTINPAGDVRAEPGSQEWALSMRLRLSVLFEDHEGCAREITMLLDNMRKFEGWRQLEDARGRLFSSFEAFCCEKQPYGLGYSTDAIDRIVSARQKRQAQLLAADPGEKPLRGKAGRPKKGEESLSNNEFQGTSASYRVRRLKRDHPEIAEALARGEYPSARAAGIAAGFVKVPTPLDILRREWRKADAEERAEFLAWARAEDEDDA